MIFTIDYSGTKTGVAGWHTQLGLSSYRAGNHGEHRKKEAKALDMGWR